MPQKNINKLKTWKYNFSFVNLKTKFPKNIYDFDTSETRWLNSTQVTMKNTQSSGTNWDDVIICDAIADPDLLFGWCLREWIEYYIRFVTHELIHEKMKHLVVFNESFPSDFWTSGNNGKIKIKPTRPSWHGHTGLCFHQSHYQLPVSRNNKIFWNSGCSFFPSLQWYKMMKVEWIKQK